MSGQVLSPDAIAALVEAAKEGKLPDEQQASQRRRGRVRTVDFTRPNKFTSEQERRISRSLETFCRTASTRLSAEIRMALELELISVSQLTWSNAHALVPNDSVSAIVDVQPVGTRLLLGVERSLILEAIELLLGGSAAPGPIKDRRLTDIDWALARHFVDRVLAQLSVIWADVAEIELAVAGLDSHMETAQLALVSEPTMALTVEARMAGGSSTLTLLVPYVAIAGVAHRFGSRDDASAEAADPALQSAVERAVGNVEVLVRAEVAAIDAPIEEVLALKPGDVLRLDAPAAAGVTLFADNVAVQRARPGRSGGRRAVQVLGPASDGGS